MWEVQLNSWDIYRMRNRSTVAKWSQCSCELYLQNVASCLSGVSSPRSSRLTLSGVISCISLWPSHQHMCIPCLQSKKVKADAKEWEATREQRVGTWRDFVTNKQSKKLCYTHGMICKNMAKANGRVSASLPGSSQSEPYHKQAYHGCSQMSCLLQKHLAP